MVSPPDDEVQINVVVETNPTIDFLLEQFDVSRLALPQAAVALPFKKLATELNVFLPLGPDKENALRKLLTARNAAATAVFNQNNPL